MSESSSADSWLDSLASKARAFDGQPPFSDQSLVDLRLGLRQLIAIDNVAAAIASDTEAEFVVDPDARGRGHGTSLLETLIARAPEGLLVWAHGDHPAARALAASHRLAAVRELLHLSAELAPVEPAQLVELVETPVTRDQVSTSLLPFRVGTDEGAWLALNALTFATHAEQGSVTRADLEQLESEDWFSADDFLLLWDGDELIGYCWLKIEDGRGEFYVVGVHPDRQGQRLGGLLFDAGLARMRELGIRSAHLYVEGDNDAALRLYRARGFAQDSIDVQYSTAKAT
jgi:mycothiol synthase